MYLAVVIADHLVEYGALFGCKLGMFLDGTAIFHVEAHLLKSRCDVLAFTRLIGKCRAICLAANLDIVEVCECLDFAVFKYLPQRVHILLAGLRQVVRAGIRQPAPVLLEKRCLNLLGAGTVGVSIVALGRCIRRIGEVDLIHIDIVELGEGQRHLLVPTAQIDLDSIAGASYGAINGIDDLNRIFRSDEQLDIGADTLKVISAGTLEPIDDIVDVVAGIFEQALVADGLEVPISVEAVAVGIRLNVAALRLRAVSTSQPQSLAASSTESYVSKWPYWFAVSYAFAQSSKSLSLASLSR